MLDSACLSAFLPNRKQVAFAPPTIDPNQKRTGLLMPHVKEKKNKQQTRTSNIIDGKKNNEKKKRTIKEFPALAPLDALRTTTMK